jgi:hypothetical protein
VVCSARFSGAVLVISLVNVLMKMRILGCGHRRIDRLPSFRRRDRSIKIFMAFEAPLVASEIVWLFDQVWWPC